MSVRTKINRYKCFDLYANGENGELVPHPSHSVGWLYYHSWSSWLIIFNPYYKVLKQTYKNYYYFIYSQFYVFLYDNK